MTFSPSAISTTPDLVVRKLVLFEAFDLASSFEIEFLETDWPNVNLAHIGLLLRELVEPESKGCANAKKTGALYWRKNLYRNKLRYKIYGFCLPSGVAILAVAIDFGRTDCGLPTWQDDLRLKWYSIWSSGLNPSPERLTLPAHRASLPWTGSSP